jgi:hypothetical protein
MCYDSLFVTYLDTGIGAFNGLFHLQGFSTMDIWSLALGLGTSLAGGVAVITLNPYYVIGGLDLQDGESCFYIKISPWPPCRLPAGKAKNKNYSRGLQRSTPAANLKNFSSFL